jgi:polar amino acid transport system substrate-binding protein
MAYIRKAGYFTAGLISGALLMTNAAWSEGRFDLSPEQPNRLRVEKIDKRIDEVKDFKFVKDGVLTIGISTSGHLPLHDYASDSKTVIGYDVDLAQIIADSLGRDLELVSVAWADWPLGLASGKFDAVISNVTVTEERKEKFDFSTYRKDELGFYVKADSAIKELKQPKDIEGLKIITDAGTNQEKVLLEWDRQNVAGSRHSKWPCRCGVQRERDAGLFRWHQWQDQAGWYGEWRLADHRRDCGHNAQGQWACSSTDQCSQRSDCKRCLYQSS